MSDQFLRHVLDLPPEVAGLRLDQALARVLPDYSRSRLQGWIASGAVQVDGCAVRSRDKVVGGERVIVQAEFAADTAVGAESLDVDVVFKDRWLFVVNKPAGLVVHPGAGNRAGTLQNALLGLDAELARVPRAGIVHRLDKDTSGLLVVARQPAVHARLVEMLAEHEVGREYLAICSGLPSGGATVDQPIGRHRTHRTKMAIRDDGREAVTHYRIEKRFRANTLLRVQLETGRTHQIRVHLAHAGWPIVGDPLYGGRRRIPPGASPELIAALDACKRQALHAARLTLAHPHSGKALEFTAPLPADMQQLLKVLTRDAALDSK